MSLTVSSTTDTQADVEAAAGIEPSEAPAAEPTEQQPPAEAVGKPVETPEAPPEEEKPEEEGDEEEGEKPEEDDRAKPKKPGRYERRIDRLEQQLAYERRIRELEAQVAGRTQPPAAQQPRQPAIPKPVQQPDETWEDYNDRVMDWKVETRLAQTVAAQQAREAQEREVARAAEWNERVNAYRAKTRDYDQTLATADHIMVPPAMQQAIMTSDNGPALVYALAQDHKELERLVKLEPLAAVRELGRLEAKITATQANPSAQKPAVSQAPEPIRPVGQGAATSTKPPDEMDFREYKAYREKQIAKRRAG